MSGIMGIRSPREIGLRQAEFSNRQPSLRCLLKKSEVIVKSRSRRIFRSQSSSAALGQRHMKKLNAAGNP